MKLGARCSGVLLVSALLLAGCASPPPPSADPLSRTWTGRLALQVEGRAAQSFSAGFELRGQADAGQLTLFSPLGGTLAVLDWAPGAASLKSGGQTRQFDSLDALATEATGAAIPLVAMFDWLTGVNTPVPGWQADLSQLAQGRLQAQRSDPPPPASLRLVFDR